MCKFNLIDAISTSIDPLAGWIDQKAPPPSWDFTMEAPPLLDDVLPSLEDLPSQGLLSPPEEGLIPDDLQDLFMCGPSAPVPALPSCEANCLLDDLLSAPPSPPLFGVLSPDTPLTPPDSSAASPACGDAVTELLPPPALSPDPPLSQQLPVEHWVPSLSPPAAEPLSPLSLSEDSRDQASTCDWSPSTLAPPAKRRQARPRPYDKQARRQVTDDERRQRKKEQNKTAATRYRLKKKEEQELICTDQEVLESRNAELKERVNTLTRELSYLKHLMKEVVKFKRAM